jgi:hypothetical protein
MTAHPSDDSPEATVRALRGEAFASLDAGDSAKAALVVVAALEAIKRQWTTRRGDDGGRQRRVWRWEAVLLKFALRSALVETSPAAPFRAQLFPAVRALWAEPLDLDDWLEQGDFSGLHPTDLAAIGLRTTGGHLPYRPYEEEFVGDLLALESPNARSIATLLANDFDPVEAGDESGLALRLYEFERLAASVARSGSPRAGPVLAALAQLAREAARRPAREPGAWPLSAESSAAFAALAGRVQARAGVSPSV